MANSIKSKPIKIKAGYVILIIELIILSFLFPLRGGIKINMDDFFYFFWYILCFINFFLLLTGFIARSKNTKVWLVLFLIISAIGPIFYVKNIILTDMEKKSRHKNYVMRMKDALIPFYQGKGTDLERRMQAMRIGITNNQTNPGRNKSGEIIESPCPSLVRSFITPDMHYIILTCLSPEGKMISYQKYLKPYFNPEHKNEGSYLTLYNVNLLSRINQQKPFIIEYVDDYTGRRFRLIEELAPFLAISDEGTIPKDMK